jgi:hypothetical protein
MIDLRAHLESNLAQARATLADDLRYLRVVKESWGSAQELERALIAEGMPQITADELMRGFKPAVTVLSARVRAGTKAVSRLERRIAGVVKWEAEERANG